MTYDLCFQYCLSLDWRWFCFPHDLFHFILWSIDFFFSNLEKVIYCFQLIFRWNSQDIHQIWSDWVIVRQIFFLLFFCLCWIFSILGLKKNLIAKKFYSQLRKSNADDYDDVVDGRLHTYRWWTFFVCLFVRCWRRRKTRQKNLWEKKKTKSSNFFSLLNFAVIGVFSIGVNFVR